MDCLPQSAGTRGGDEKGISQDKQGKETMVRQERKGKHYQRPPDQMGGVRIPLGNIWRIFQKRAIWIIHEKETTEVRGKKIEQGGGVGR